MVWSGVSRGQEPLLQSEMPSKEVSSMSPVSNCGTLDGTMVLQTPGSVLVCSSRSAR